MKKLLHLYWKFIGAYKEIIELYNLPKFIKQKKYLNWGNFDYKVVKHKLQHIFDDGKHILRYSNSKHPCYWSFRTSSYDFEDAVQQLSIQLKKYNYIK